MLAFAVVATRSSNLSGYAQLLFYASGLLIGCLGQPRAENNGNAFLPHKQKESGLSEDAAPKLETGSPRSGNIELAASG